jgi:hypothetical protein
MLDMHANTVFSDLHFNLKADYAESTIFLQATTRGDISVQKSIFVGVKKALISTSLQLWLQQATSKSLYLIVDLKLKSMD